MRRWREWLPSVATAFFWLLTVIVYPYTAEQTDIMVYVQVTACALLPTVLLLGGRVLKSTFPVSLNVLVAAQVVLASFLGSGMGFYQSVPWWDLLMHGTFGVLAAAILHTLLRRDGNGLGRTLLWMTVFLSVMGLAALWEVFEYGADLIFGGDAQRVLAALQAGISPVRDTMTDILITAVGVGAHGLVLGCQLLLRNRKSTC